MRLRNWITLGAVSLGAIGLGLAVKGLLPQRLALDEGLAVRETAPDLTNLPEVEVTFLRSGYATWPEFVMARGNFSLAPHITAYSAVLIRHPQATFLYDTGLCNDIYLYLRDQSLFFRSTLARFTFEHSLASHLKRQGLQASDLDFALISHLHWDHVSGVPDLPNVQLRMHRLEYEAAREGALQKNNGLIQNLIGENAIELFNCDGPPYMGFRSSFDLFGDGSIVLVPLPGHTVGQVGMFINRSNGARLFLIADAAHMAENYQRPAALHPIFESLVTRDIPTARQTLVDLYHLSQRHPEISLVPMHDGRMQELFMSVERAQVTTR